MRQGEKITVEDQFDPHFKEITISHPFPSGTDPAVIVIGLKPIPTMSAISYGGLIALHKDDDAIKVG